MMFDDVASSFVGDYWLPNCHGESFGDHWSVKFSVWSAELEVQEMFQQEIHTENEQQMMEIKIQIIVAFGALIKRIFWKEFQNEIVSIVAHALCVQRLWLSHSIEQNNVRFHFVVIEISNFKLNRIINYFTEGKMSNEWAHLSTDCK